MKSNGKPKADDDDDDGNFLLKVVRARATAAKEEVELADLEAELNRKPSSSRGILEHKPTAVGIPVTKGAADGKETAVGDEILAPGAYAMGPSTESEVECNNESSESGNENDSISDHPTSRAVSDEESGFLYLEDTTNSGLVEAHPAIPAENLVQAEPVDHLVLIEHKRLVDNQKRKQTSLIWGVLAVVLVGVAATIGILVHRGAASDPTDVDTPTITAAQSTTSPVEVTTTGTDATTSRTAETLRQSLPDYTLLSLEEPFSPQTKAFHWLFNDEQDVIDNLPLWRHRQLFALAVYYYSTDGPNWPLGIADDWLDLSGTRTECDWFSTQNGEFFSDGGFGETGLNSYVESCNEKGEFQSIHLTHGSLFGAAAVGSFIPPEIALLSTSLKHIILGSSGVQNSSLIDFMPPQFFQLSNLETLLFFSDDVTGSIPSELGLLTQLQALGLNDLPFLSGSIPTEIAQATDLRMLGLSNNPMLIGTIPSEILLLTHLQVLDLAQASLTGTLPNLNTESMGHLEFLDLRGNNLSGSLPASWGTLVANNGLLHVDVSENALLTGTVPTDLCSLNREGCFYIHSAWGNNHTCTFDVTCSKELCGCGCSACLP